MARKKKPPRYRPNDFRYVGKSQKSQRKHARKVWQYVKTVLQLTGKET